MASMILSEYSKDLQTGRIISEITKHNYESNGLSAEAVSKIIQGVLGANHTRGLFGSGNAELGSVELPSVDPIGIVQTEYADVEEEEFRFKPTRYHDSEEVLSNIKLIEPADDSKIDLILNALSPSASSVTNDGSVDVDRIKRIFRDLLPLPDNAFQVPSSPTNNEDDIDAVVIPCKRGLEDESRDESQIKRQKLEADDMEQNDVNILSLKQFAEDGTQTNPYHVEPKAPPTDLHKSHCMLTAFLFGQVLSTGNKFAFEQLQLLATADSYNLAKAFWTILGEFNVNGPNLKKEEHLQFVQDIVPWLMEQIESFQQDENDSFAIEMMMYYEYILGICYDLGYYVTKDAVKACELYLSSANRGYVAAMDTLGLCYECGGDGLKVDLEQAQQWLEKGAEKGFTRCQYDLGMLLVRDSNKNEEKVTQGIDWLKAAAEQGYTPAVLELGEIYFLGKVGKPDLCEATAWYMRAADKGSDEAQYNLGFGYKYGDGLTKDPEKAVYWFRKAAEQGHAKAQFMLADALQFGDGVKASPNEAVEWFRKSAEQGYPKSQYKLGLCYAKGEGGLERDVVKAAQYWQMAAEKGNEQAATALKKMLSAIA